VAEADIATSLHGKEEATPSLKDVKFNRRAETLCP